MNKVILIVYTTRYREGGQQFKRVAETMYGEKVDGDYEVICEAIESKADLKSSWERLRDSGKEISEFHFIGHSGMYGPMYGTTSYPEQFSPHEIKNLSIPFSKDAAAYFHCCRSARWFAPYFSRMQKVKTYGYHWYTTFSARADRFKLPGGFSKPDKLYCFGCPGKKSHGIGASLKKYLGLMPAEEMKTFEESELKVDATYNEVADLYANTFRDITVRKDEISWVKEHLPPSAGSVLDIGCGNGALLKEIRDKVKSGIGVDISTSLIAHAKQLSKDYPHLSFQQIKGPELPFQSNQFDLVISLLSFRYLDWDPIMLEIERVLKPEGKLLIIDMVTAPVKWHECGQLLFNKMNHYVDRIRNPAFYHNLKKLVTHPGWKTMLKYNPIRSQHEMKWYLESRFPGRKVEVINVGMNSRILAFDSRDMKDIKNIKLTYP